MLTLPFLVVAATAALPQKASPIPSQVLDAVRRSEGADPSEYAALSRTLLETVGRHPGDLVLVVAGVEAEFGPWRKLRFDGAALAVVEAALADLRPSEKRRAAEGAVKRRSDRVCCEVALKLLDPQRDLEDLRAVLAISSFVDLTEPRQAQLVTRTLTDRVQRSDEGFDLLSIAFRASDGDRAHVLANAIATSQSPDALDVLAGGLSSAALDECELLSAISRLAALPEWSVRRSASRRVVESLDETSTLVLQIGLDAYATIGCAEGCDDVVRFLSHDHPSVRSAAQRALASATGASFPADPSPWNAWMARERTWFEQNGDQLQVALRCRAPARMRFAMREARKHPMFRDEFCDSLLAALSDPDESLAAEACATLGRLKPYDGWAFLQDMTSDPSARVQAAARAALTRGGISIAVSRVEQ